MINHDLALTSKWLTTKTEIVIFRAKNKKITKHLNFRTSGQKVEPCTKVKYLGVILQNGKDTTNILNTKINRAIGLFAKIRHYTKISTENSILCTL